jgi:DDE superfamily endonuclease
MKGEQQKIFHKGSSAKINAFITLLYTSNKIKFKISKSRTSTDFIDHLRNIGNYIKKSKIKRFILVTDNASFHVSRQTKQFIENQNLKLIYSNFDIYYRHNLTFFANRNSTSSEFYNISKGKRSSNLSFVCNNFRLETF